MSDAWISSVPALAGMETACRDRLAANAQEMVVPAGAKVFEVGAPCGAFMMVLEGCVRVQMIAENGGEIVLYRVEDGQTCILTTACLLANEAYGAEAVTEVETRAVALPEPQFQSLLAESDVFRRFVFSSYGQRISDLVLLVEEVAFRRIDARLAHFLRERRDGGGVIERTHQQIAAELGSAREVISRQLKEFERRGWIAMSRGRIKVLKPDSLPCEVAL